MCSRNEPEPTTKIDGYVEVIMLESGRLVNKWLGSWKYVESIAQCLMVWLSGSIIVELKCLLEPSSLEWTLEGFLKSRIWRSFKHVLEHASEF